MDIDIKVPQLPESVTDATLVAWRKQPGDTVQRDETLADLETDKVVLELPAPADGVMTEILVQDGTTVSSGDLLAKLDSARYRVRRRERHLAYLFFLFVERRRAYQMRRTQKAPKSSMQGFCKSSLKISYQSSPG